VGHLSGVQRTRHQLTSDAATSIATFSGQGDVSRRPGHATKVMLATTNGANLNNSLRSADFRSEVDWRVKLREASYPYQPAARKTPPAYLPGRVPRVLPDASAVL